MEGDRSRTEAEREGSSLPHHEISVGGCGAINLSAEKLGLTLAEGQMTLAGLQRPFGSGAGQMSIAAIGDAASAAGLNVR